MNVNEDINYFYIYEMSNVKIYKSSSSTSKSIKTQSNNSQTVPISIDIIEPYSPDVISFDSKEEFIEYLTENIDEMNKMTTQKLNKTYKIDGYTITKNRKENGERGDL